ncbi:MAG: hypothetical protein N2234_01195 [Planctomycetota bacterium]|nr:hypothetical protein [Planctomycetota bacterium]
MRGLVLIELLLTLVLLGVAAVSVLSLLSVLMVASADTANRTAALRLAQERLEQVSSLLGLSEGTGSNPDDGFLPMLSKVCTRSFSGLYLTESDYYRANYGTAPSLTALSPPQRVDRITQIEWKDDSYGGTAQDYFLVTVSVIWKEKGARQIVTLKRFVLFM